jgi:hypothetical protein
VHAPDALAAAARGVWRRRTFLDRLTADLVPRCAPEEQARSGDAQPSPGG